MKSDLVFNYAYFNSVDLVLIIKYQKPDNSYVGSLTGTVVKVMKGHYYKTGNYLYFQLKHTKPINNRIARLLYE